MGKAKEPREIGVILPRRSNSRPGDGPVAYSSLRDPRIWLAIGVLVATVVVFVLVIVLNEP